MITLFDFTQQAAVQAWRSVDDRVMGGLSISEMIADEHDGQTRALFRGNVAMENNGGFCSVRALLPRRLPSGTSRLWIRCADGLKHGPKSYYLNLRTNSGFDGISYRTQFIPTDSLKLHEFSASEFKAVFRGRTVPDAPALLLSEAQQAGLMIADSQSGAFELAVYSLGAR